MRIAPLADVKARLSAYLDRCEKEGPIVITRNGTAVGVLIAPLGDDDLEMLLLARSPRFQALLDQSRASIKGGKGLSRKDFWKVVAQRHLGSERTLPSAGGPQRRQLNKPLHRTRR